MLVESVVAVEETERVADLVRQDGEQVVVPEGGGRLRSELRGIERCRVDEPAGAVAVGVDDDPRLRRPPGADPLPARILTLMANGAPPMIASLCLIMALASLIPLAILARLIPSREITG